MSLMKSLYIAPALFSLVLSSTSSFAQAETSSTPPKTANKTPTYGDNPNIFEVLAHKTSDTVVNTAEKVGDATERGVAKIKPKVNQAWDNITAKHTVEVPIEQKSLSNSSNNELAPTAHQPPPPKPQAIPAEAQTRSPAKATPPEVQQPNVAAPTKAPVTTDSIPNDKAPVIPSTTSDDQTNPAPTPAEPSQNQQQVKPVTTTLPQANHQVPNPTIIL